MEINYMPLQQQYQILTNTYCVMMSLEILFTNTISITFIIIRMIESIFNENENK